MYAIASCGVGRCVRGGTERIGSGWRLAVSVCVSDQECVLVSVWPSDEGRGGGRERLDGHRLIGRIERATHRSTPSTPASTRCSQSCRTRKTASATATTKPAAVRLSRAPCPVAGRVVTTRQTAAIDRLIDRPTRAVPLPLHPRAKSLCG